MSRQIPATIALAFALLVPLTACAPRGNSTAKGTGASEGFITADDGVKLFYRKVGNGPQTVVIPADLFMHPAFDGLAEGRTLVFYDMRNRGQSDSVSIERENSIRRDVVDLENLREQLGIEKLSLVGWSYLGLMVALYAIDHPDRIDRLVQIGPVPFRLDAVYPEGLRAGNYMAAMDSTALAELRRLRQQGLHLRVPRDYCEREWAVTRYTLVGNPANVDRVPAAPCANPNEWPINFDRHLARHFASVQSLGLSRDSVARIQRPALVIHGTLDRNAPYGAGREWALSLPEARLVTVDGAAHCPWADEPELVLSSIDTFLDGHWPERAEKVLTLERPSASLPRR
jgi:proline iminopeptidase